MKRGARLGPVYKKLLAEFGPQKWWPAETAFEVAVGAILTQSTNWKNVERAIRNLKTRRVFSPEKLHRLTQGKLARFIRPAGYYHVKAARLKNFLDFLFTHYGGRMQAMRRVTAGTLRKELLAINGIGQETADSILLYALGKPVFVIDAYTRRVLLRHGFIGEKDDYAHLQGLFTRALPKSTALFNEYHALIVKLGKEYCTKSAPRCPQCPLSSQ